LADSRGTAADQGLGRVSTFYRLTASRFGWFAACSGASSHRLPQGSGRGIVSARTNALEGARTGFVRPLSKARSMSLMGQPRHFGRGFGCPLLPRKRPNRCVALTVAPGQERKYDPPLYRTTHAVFPTTQALRLKTVHRGNRRLDAPAIRNV